MKTILGFIVFCAVIVYQWLPFFGAVSIITGIIGFFTGSTVAGRAFVLGVILLGVRYLVAIVFQKMIDRS